MKKTILLPLILLTVVLAASEMTLNTIRLKRWHAIHNGSWVVKFDTVAASDNGTITVKGNAADSNATFSDPLALDQNEPENLIVSGWINRTHGDPGGQKAIVAFGIAATYSTGEVNFFILPQVSPDNAGKWQETNYVFKPEKALRDIRVLCLNYNSGTSAAFRDITVTRNIPLFGKTAGNITRLENRNASLEFAEQAGELRLASFWDKTLKSEFISAAKNRKNLWDIILKDTHSKIPIRVSGGGELTVETHLNELKAVWRDIPLNDGGQMDVHVSVCLKSDSASSVWNISAQVRSNRFLLEKIQFPTIGGLTVPSSQEKTFLLFPQDIGRLIRNPKNNLPGALNLKYGTWYLAMQFMALYGEH